MSDRPISRFPVPDVGESSRRRRGENPEGTGEVRLRTERLPRSGAAPDEFRAFFAHHDALMEKEGGLTKGEREMIVVATSGLNDCLYCVVAHGAVLRIREKIRFSPTRSRRTTGARTSRRDRGPCWTSPRRCRCAPTSGRRRRRGVRARHGFSTGRRLGHRGDLGVLRAVEPHGELDEDAAERRVLLVGARSEGVALRPSTMKSKEDQAMSGPAVPGSCFCGAVRFSIRPPTLFCGHCHCSMCRRNHGAGYVTWFGIARGQFAIDSGERIWCGFAPRTTARGRSAVVRELALLRIHAPSGRRRRRARQHGRSDRSSAAVPFLLFRSRGLDGGERRLAAPGGPDGPRATRRRKRLALTAASGSAATRRLHGT